MKICVSCKVTKEESEFYKRKDTISGLENSCKICRGERDKIWAKQNPEKVKEIQQRYREKYPERGIAKDKRRWAEHREEESVRHRKWRMNNPEKALARAMAWTKANPEKVAISKRKNYLKRTYGLVGDAFNVLLSAQNNKCAICHNPFSSTRDRHVDHCHTTNKVRGLLCSGCNSAIGSLKDSPKNCISAARYLKLSRYLK